MHLNDGVKEKEAKQREEAYQALIKNYKSLQEDLQGGGHGEYSPTTFLEPAQHKPQGQQVAGSKNHVSCF